MEPEQEKTGKEANVVTLPHGKQQQMKMELLDMIHGGEDPFDIILKIAKRLESESGEPGYADYVKNQLRTVYGLAMGEKKPLADELREVEERLERIRKSREDPVFTEEEKIRMGFAIERHEKDIMRLRELIDGGER